MTQCNRITEAQLAEQRRFCELIRVNILPLGRKAMVQTFGCQQNEADSERLCGMLCEMGYTITQSEAAADLILVNTCAVREHAELKALSITGNFKHLKAKKPHLLIGICGCMVTQEHRKNDIKQRYPYVDFLFGTSMLYRLPEIVYHTMQDKKRSFYLDDSAGNIAEGLPVYRNSSFQAWVSIMYGCNNFCTYCVVPYVRGRERSRYPEHILSEVRDLIAKGYKEITLLGQNVNSYGKDLDLSYDFSDLLDDIDKIDGDFQIRFMTSHPKDASQKLFDTMARSRHIAHHFHLPLQSGSDRILATMNRRYTQAQFLEKVDHLRRAIPDIGITTDIIVGFPGETEEDFEQTLAVLERVRFDNIYSFQYSKRNGTPAATMEGQVPAEVTNRRFMKMLAMQNQISKEKSEAYLHEEVAVLVEGVSKSNSDKLTGRTAQNRLVHFVGSADLIGSFQTVRVDFVDAYSMLGTLVEQ